MAVDRPIDQFIPGPEGMPGCHDLGRVLLSVDATISARRVVRIDVANQARGGIGSSEYRGRSRAREYRQLRAVPANLARFFEGARNAPAVGRACRHPASALFATGSRAMRESWQNASCLNSVAAKQGDKLMPFAIRHSLLAIRPQADATP